MTEDLIKSMRENVEKSRELVKGCRENQTIVIDHDEATRIAQEFDYCESNLEKPQDRTRLARAYLAIKAENEAALNMIEVEMVRATKEIDALKEQNMKLRRLARAAEVLNDKEGYGTYGNSEWDRLRECIEDLK